MKSQRSIRLKKYGIVYSAHVNSIDKNSPIPKSIFRQPEKVIVSQQISVKEKKKKKKLNEYQKFVKDESCKEKYKNMKATERMSAISQQWEKKKRENKKKK